MAQALADQGNAAADHKANLRRLEEIKEWRGAGDPVISASVDPGG
ncbi:MAG TPA: hypothetical protein VFB83_02865 [Propionibacteriaceae bacterium]|nr:hypothetical protein [Propionibacteriaceae bacterium]